MTLSRDELARIERLRALFLDDTRGGRTLPDYWRDEADLAAYDRTLAQRIGWKWQAVLDECRQRGFGSARGRTVLDLGCGTGIAARTFVAAFGAHEVRCYDRSPRATAFACRRLQALPDAPKVVPLSSVADERPDVLLVSHVLGELDAEGEQALQALLLRSTTVLLVEPGNKPTSRRLSALRDSLRASFLVRAPCPHQAACPVLARPADWCHFFAAPPPEVFTNGDQVRTWKALGIDARALPYSFLWLERGSATHVSAAPAPSVPHRVLGRPELHPHTLGAQLCTADGLRSVELQKRHHGELWRTVKKHPESVRWLPEG